MQDSLEKSIEFLTQFDLKLKKTNTQALWFSSTERILCELQKSFEEDITRLIALIGASQSHLPIQSTRTEDLMKVLELYFQMILDKVRLYEESLKEHVKSHINV